MKLRSATRAWGEQAAEIVAANNNAQEAVNALVKHRVDKDPGPEPRVPSFGDFTERETKAIYTTVHKRIKTRGGFNEGPFVKNMAKTQPVVAKPRFNKDKRPHDLWRILAQIEMLGFWGMWSGRTGRRGLDPGYFAKAVLVVMAMVGESAHFDDNVTLVRSGEFGAYRFVFRWIEEAAAALVGRRPQRFVDKVYERVLTQVGLIVDPTKNPGALTTDVMVVVNTDLMKQLNRWYPNIGRYLAIDGMLVKAWVKQAGKRKTHESEMRLRRRAVNATAIYLDGKNGKPGRFLRGYYLFVLVDIASNLPVVWALFPATTGRTEDSVDVGKGHRVEARALRYVLNHLFEIWPECPVEAIVADRAWDHKDAIKDCAVNFGIHLIVDRDDPSWDREPTYFSSRNGDNRDNYDPYPSIDRFDGRGVVYCRHHPDTPMIQESSRFVGRLQREKRGLKPGEASSEGAFTLRMTCPEGGPRCGRLVDVPMSLDWGALPYYPHTTESGRQREYAFRLAMFARRNACEALFGALKVGHKVGLDGADRTHTDNEPTVETLLSLALLSRTAMVIAAERIKRGLFVADLPPELLRDLEPPPIDD